jgi:hypothetical protein
MRGSSAGMIHAPNCTIGSAVSCRLTQTSNDLAANPNLHPKGDERYCAHALAVADGRYLIQHCKADEECPVIIRVKLVRELSEQKGG